MRLMKVFMVLTFLMSLGPKARKADRPPRIVPRKA